MARPTAGATNTTTRSSAGAPIPGGLFPLKDDVEDGYAGDAPVGCFAPNGYGLFDMAGNVWEYARDWYVPEHPPSPATDPQGPDMALAAQYAGPTGPSVVIKGGSYLCAPNFCARYRPAARQPQELSLGASHLGFRTVLNDPGEKGRSTRRSELRAFEDTSGANEASEYTLKAKREGLMLSARRRGRHPDGSMIARRARNGMPDDPAGNRCLGTPLSFEDRPPRQERQPDVRNHEPAGGEPATSSRRKSSFWNYPRGPHHDRAWYRHDLDALREPLVRGAVATSRSLLVGLSTLVLASWIIILVHCSEVLIWAAFFFYWTGGMPNVSTAYYFALLEYDLGSNLNLPLHWRLLEGLTAIAGVLTFAWSTGVLLTLAQSFQEQQLLVLQQRRGARTRANILRTAPVVGRSASGWVGARDQLRNQLACVRVRVRRCAGRHVPGPVLPPHHLGDDTKSVVNLATGTLVLSALVIGLLTSFAKDDFDAQSKLIQNSAADLSLLDRVMRQYGPETGEARELLRRYTALKIALTGWRRTQRTDPAWITRPRSRCSKAFRQSC